MTTELDPFELDYLGKLAATLAPLTPDVSVREFDSYARRLLEKGVPVLFSSAHLAFVVGLSISDLADLAGHPARHYSGFWIAKRRGGSRPIDAPSRRLKHVQRWVQRNVTAR